MEKSLLIPEKKDGFGGFGTIVDLMSFMIDNDIPMNAAIEYAGCGTHRIEFVWEEVERGIELDIQNPNHSVWDL